MDRSAKIWDRFAENYAKSPIADEAAYQKKLKITRTYFQPDMDVMEFGCGTGGTAILHAPYVKHIHAIDFSAKMIEIAQGKAGAQNVKNVTFEQATIDEFSVPDGSLDVVLGLSILHLLESKDAAIAKVHKMLKPGGVFVSSTVCIGDMAIRFAKPIASVGHFFGLFPLLKAFTAKELKASIIEAGFEIDHYWHPGKGKAVFIVAKKAE